MATAAATVPNMAWPASPTKTPFPPATFQLRLRSLSSIIYIVSGAPRSGRTSGSFYLSLHEKPSSTAFWTSCKKAWSADREETRLVWADLSPAVLQIHGAYRSLVVKVWFEDVQNKELILQTCMGVYFSGLSCLGKHLPGRLRLSGDILVFCLAKSYFVAPDEVGFLIDSGEAEPAKPVVNLGSSKDTKTVKSYATDLLSRLQFIQRALRKQEAANLIYKNELRARGVADYDNLSEQMFHKKPRRQMVMLRPVKTAATRQREMSLCSSIQSTKIRVQLLTEEKKLVEKHVKDMVSRTQALACFIEETTSRLMINFHTLSREKANLRDWMQRYQEDCSNHAVWSSVLREQRLRLVHEMSFIYPVGNLESKTPTLRCVAFPSASDMRESPRNDLLTSVVAGWLADLVNVLSTLLGLPLRYPVHLLGSMSSVVDPFKASQDGATGNATESQEFPLFYGKSSGDWGRFEYGMYLLNKNLSQLGWQCNLPTLYLRPVLINVADLMNIGKGIKPLTSATYRALPNLRELMPPPQCCVQEPVLTMRDRRMHIQRSSPAHYAPPVPTTTASGSGRRSPVEADNELLDQSKEDDSHSDREDYSSSSSSTAAATSTSCSPEFGKLSDDVERRVKCPDDELLLADPDPVKPKDNFLFWGEVTNRSIALSTNTSSFQRPRTSQS